MGELSKNEITLQDIGSYAVKAQIWWWKKFNHLKICFCNYYLIRFIFATVCNQIMQKNENEAFCPR